MSPGRRLNMACERRSTVADINYTRHRHKLNTGRYNGQALHPLLIRKLLAFVKNLTSKS